LQRGDAAANCLYMYHIVVNVDSYDGLMVWAETSENATREEKERQEPQ